MSIPDAYVRELRKMKDPEEQFALILATLSPREEQILRGLFGFHEARCSLEVIATREQSTVPQIRVIATKGLSKLMLTYLREDEDAMQGVQEMMSLIRRALKRAGKVTTYEDTHET